MYSVKSKDKGYKTTTFVAEEDSNYVQLDQDRLKGINRVNPFTDGE